MPPTDVAMRARLSSWLKSHLPRELVALLRELLRLRGVDRWRFAALRLRRALRPPLALATLPREPTLMFVCRGNKLRSPMAEALLRRAAAAHALDGLRVTSAGTHARSDLPVPPDAIAAASRHGVSLAAHEPRTLTASLVQDADVVFVMDRSNEADLITRFAHAERRVVLLGAFSRDGGDGAVIPDPDNGTAADLTRCYARVEACVSAVTREIARARPPVR